MLGHRGDPGADRIAGFPQLIHKRFECRNDVGIRGKKWIAGDRLPCFKRNLVWAELAQVAVNEDTVCLPEPLPGNRGRSNTHGSLARRRAAPAAVISDSIFLPIRIIGMTRTKRIDEAAVVFAPRVFVTTQ